MAKRVRLMDGDYYRRVYYGHYRAGGVNRNDVHPNLWEGSTGTSVWSSRRVQGLFATAEKAAEAVAQAWQRLHPDL